MWSKGRHFRTERVDSKRNTQDCGVMANFEQESGATLHYCGMIQNIMKVGFRTFHICMMDVKWFKDVVGQGPQATVKKHSSGFMAIDSTKFWRVDKETFVLPQHCEQVKTIDYIYLRFFKCSIIKSFTCIIDTSSVFLNRLCFNRT